MTTDKDFKLDSLQDSTAWSLTAIEMANIRSLQLDQNKDEADLTQEAGNVIIPTNEGDKKISDFVTELKTEASKLNLNDMTRDQKKAAVSNFVKETSVFGVNLGRWSEIVALIQMVVKPLLWADGIFGPKTFDAIMAYEAPVEEPTEPAIAVEPTDMEGKDYSDIMKDVLNMKLPIDSVPNCRGCFDTLRTLWYVTPQDTLKNVVFMPITDTLIFQNTGTPMVVSMKGIYNMVGGYMKKINGPLLVQRITDAFEKVSISVADKATKEMADKSKEMALQFGKDLSYRKELLQDAMNGFNVPDIIAKLIVDPNSDSTIDTVKSTIGRQSATLRYNRDQLVELSDRVTKSSVLEPTKTNILNDIAKSQKVVVNEIEKRVKIDALLVDYKTMKNGILALANKVDLGMKLPIDEALAQLRLVPSTIEKYRKNLANSMKKIAVPCDKAWNTDRATKFYEVGNKMLTDIENRVKNKAESNGLPYGVMSASA